MSFKQSARVAVAASVFYLQFLLISAALSSSAVQQCDLGWVHYLDKTGHEGGDSCLMLNSTSANFSQAAKLCAAHKGAHLLTVASDASYFEPGLASFVSSLAATALGRSARVWVGARTGHGGQWTWIDSRTPASNLNCYPARSCGPWSVQTDDGSDSSDSASGSDSGSGSSSSAADGCVGVMNLFVMDLL
jgi:hypothetical protein